MKPIRALPLAAAMVACFPTMASAGEASGAYPTRPIRMLVGFAPGGGTDTTARALTPKLAERLGQQIIVDNRPGAAGNIATDITTKAPPDGYTILMGTIAALAINPTLYGNLPFDPLRDLAPVTQAVDSTNILVVHPTVPAKSVKELIALSKTNGVISNELIVRADPDGHTIWFGHIGTLVLSPVITKVPYDVQKGGRRSSIDQTYEWSNPCQTMFTNTSS